MPNNCSGSNSTEVPFACSCPPSRCLLPSPLGIYIMHSSQLCHRRSARHWSPLIELPTEVVSRVASFLNGGDLARLLITAKAFMDAHGVILNAQTKRAWDQRAAALTVYTNRGPLGDLMYELGSRPRGVFQGEVLKRYLQTTPSGLIDPRMTMSVESSGGTF